MSENLPPATYALRHDLNHPTPEVNDRGMFKPASLLETQ